MGSHQWMASLFASGRDADAARLASDALHDNPDLYDYDSFVEEKEKKAVKTVQGDAVSDCLFCSVALLSFCCTFFTFSSQNIWVLSLQMLKEDVWKKKSSRPE
jgi:hypothetical protein